MLRIQLVVVLCNLNLKSSQLLPDFAVQETGTGNGTLVMMYKEGGSNPVQDPFPVVGWRSVALSQRKEPHIC